MRWPMIAMTILGTWILAEGVKLNARIPDLVRTPEMRDIGESRRWPGSYVTTTQRCYFEPDYDAWENRMKPAAKVLALIGAGIAGAGVCSLAWLRIPKPVAAQMARHSPANSNSR